MLSFVACQCPFQVYPVIKIIQLPFLYERSIPMRLLIVRHANPDTRLIPDTGLGEGAKAWQTVSGADSGGGLLCIAAGACEDTASLTFKKPAARQTTCSWLREFARRRYIRERIPHCVWDWLPDADGGAEVF